MFEGIKIDSNYRSEFWFLTPTGLHVFRIIERESFFDPKGVTGKLQNDFSVIILTCDSSSQKSKSGLLSINI